MKGKIHIIKGFGLGNGGGKVFSVYCSSHDGVIPSMKNNITGKYTCGHCFKIINKAIKEKLRGKK